MHLPGLHIQGCYLEWHDLFRCVTQQVGHMPFQWHDMNVETSQITCNSTVGSTAFYFNNKEDPKISASHGDHCGCSMH